MTSFWKRFCLFSIFSTVFLAFADPAPAPERVSVAQVQPAIGRLQDWYNKETGLWLHTGWWNSANALTTLIDFSRASRSRQYDSVIARTYAEKLHSGFLNQYYDDEGWWALAWIDAYDLTGNPDYLHTAASIFDDMTHGWDSTCGGGLWWNKRRHYKNAIPNELFLSVAAHLAARTGDRSRRTLYLAWADREWRWFRHSGMIESDHLISDGLNSQCKDNHAQKWSYNQGVILGGLAELSLEHGQHGTLRQARRIADAAMTHLVTSGGILRDPCEPKCGADGSQFKGIFMRNLALLDQRQPRALYVDFIERNAESILTRDQGPDHSLGVVWSGPPATANPATQSSALDALIAALEVRSQGGAQ